MTSSLSSARLPRTITAGIAALVLAVPSGAALAAPARSSEPQLHQLCAGVSLPECERQVLASRGTGAPAHVAAAVQRPPSSDAGFDWNAAAAGAAGVVCLLLLGRLGAIASRRRRRVRPAG